MKFNKKYSWIIGALVIALLAVGVSSTTTAYAHEGGPGGGKGGGRSLSGEALEAAADLLNMSTDELTAALESGQKLRELVEAAGVDIQEFKDTLGAIREQSIRDRIAQGLEDGTITQEKADKILERLENGFRGGRGGRGGRGPRQGGANQGEGFPGPGLPPSDVNF